MISGLPSPIGVLPLPPPFYGVSSGQRHLTGSRRQSIIMNAVVPCLGRRATGRGKCHTRESCLHPEVDTPRFVVRLETADPWHRGVTEMRRRSPLHLLTATLLWLIPVILVGCSNLTGPRGTPFIGASLISFTPASEPPGFAGAGALVIDDYDGSPIDNASVRMNGEVLAYNSDHQYYEGYVRVHPGETVFLSVTIGKKEYTAACCQFSSYPVISEPVPGDIWARATSHNVSWSGGAPVENVLAYNLGVLDAADPNGPLVWPSNSIEVLAPGATSHTIPSNSLTAGSRLVMLGAVTAVNIPTASEGSALAIGGFDQVPITVATGSTLASVTVSPEDLALPVAYPRQFAATGTHGDGTLHDISASVTWSSSDTDVAVISNDAGSVGIADTIGAGTATITATTEDVSGSTDLTVRPWKLEAPGTASALYEVIWSGTQYVAVGDGGVILTSADGATWTERDSGTAARLYGVAWSGSQFVAVGSHGKMPTSPDGVTWSEGYQASGLDIIWSGTQFVVVGGDILTSPDGTTWTSQGSAQLYGVVWSGTQYVAVGAYGKILTSPDAVTWTEQTSGTSSYLTDVTWTGSQFVAVGSYDSTLGAGPTVTSSDGVTWTPHASGAGTFLNGVAWSGNQFVAVGEGGSIVVSPDGITWTSQSIVSGRFGEHLNGVAWDGDRFIAVGNFGMVLTSTSGQSQSQQKRLTPRKSQKPQRGILQSVFWGAALHGAHARGELSTP